MKFSHTNPNQYIFMSSNLFRWYNQLNTRTVVTMNTDAFILEVIYENVDERSQMKLTNYYFLKTN